MKILSGEEIQRLSRIRAMFPEDWCQAQLEDDQKDYDALKVIEESHRKLNGELREQMKNMLTPEEAGSIIGVFTALRSGLEVFGFPEDLSNSIIAKLKTRRDEL